MRDRERDSRVCRSRLPDRKSILPSSSQKEKKLIPFVEKHNLKAQVVHLNDPDANTWIEKVDAKWSGSIPATLIFNNEKREFFEQTFTKEHLKRTINNF
jgi:hypothetical protein